MTTTDDEADSTNELLYPILFNYRHSVELYLKAIVGPRQYNHDLIDLIKQFQHVVLDDLRVAVPPSIVDRLREFDDVDRASTTFRYPECGISFRSGALAAASPRSTPRRS